MKFDNLQQTIFNNSTFRVTTPEGEMFVTVIEDSASKVTAIDIKIGKAGSALVAWTHSFARILTLAIEKGASVEDLIVELSGQTSDKLRTLTNGVIIRSGPEAVSYALMRYQKEKYRNIYLDEEDENGRRRFGRMVR